MLQIFLQKMIHVRNALGSFLHRVRFFVYAAPLGALLVLPDFAHAVDPSTAILASLFALTDIGQQLIVWVAVIWAVVHFLLYKIAMGLFLWLIDFLIGVSQYNSFLGAPIVTIGWAVTRDIANMFLVVALLVIAFGVIFDSHHYQAQKMLKDFFIAAILVNFSKMICGVMLDAAQVVMMTFVSGFSDTAAGNFVKMFQLSAFLSLAASNAGLNTTASAAELASQSSNLFASVTNEFFSFILIFFGIVAVLSMVSLLVGRIITIWFLIIVSPLAFVLNILPMTNKYSQQWWKAFEKQLIAGPIVAFVIWVSLASTAVSKDAFNLTMQSQQGAAAFAEVANSSQQAVAGTAISQWTNLAMYFVPILLFIMGAQWAVKVSGGLAQKLSKMTAGTVSKYGRKGLGAVGKDFGRVFTGQSRVTQATGRATQWAGRGLEGVGKKYGVTPLQSLGGAIAEKSGSTLIAGAAVQRARIKSLKKFGTSIGIGKEAQENYETRVTEADADLVEQKASRNLQRTREKSRDTKAKAESALTRGKITTEQRDAAVRAADQDTMTAQTAMNVARNKAGKMRATKVGNVEKKLEEEGLTDAGTIEAKMNSDLQSGKGSQIEKDALASLHKKALEADRKKQVDLAKNRGDSLDQIRDLNKKIDQDQKPSIDRMKSLMTQATGQRVPSNTEAEMGRQAQFEKASTRDGKVMGTGSAAQTAVNTVRSAGKSADDMALSMEDSAAIAKAIGEKVVGIEDPATGMADVKKQREAISEALRHVPVKMRDGVLRSMRTMTFKRLDASGAQLQRPDATGNMVNVPDQMLVPSVRNLTGSGHDYNDVDVNYIADAEATRDARKSGPYVGKFNEEDLRMVKNAKGRFEFKTPKDARVLETEVRNNPAKVVAQINPEALHNIDVQQSIGKAISSPAELIAIRDQLMADKNYNQDMVIEIMRGLKDAVVHNAESEPIRKAVETSQIFDAPKSRMSHVLGTARDDVLGVKVRPLNPNRDNSI